MNINTEEIEIENSPNLGRSQPVGNYCQWLGFCDECGGTGRSESGCQPCEVCEGGRI